MNPAETAQKKAEFIQGMFASVHGTYERLNRILTFGLDTAWRRQAAAIAVKTGGRIFADVCTGTGETAVLIRKAAPADTAVYAIDFSLPMMREAAKKPGARGIQFIASDIKNLSFPDETFDVITLSFATRNLNLDRETLVQTFAEIRRVLKPGGCFINLETSQPSNPLIRKCFNLYIRLFVELIGANLSGSRAAYAYLARSIRSFYDAPTLSEILLSAGFSTVTYRPMFLGVTAIHQAERQEGRVRPVQCTLTTKIIKAGLSPVLYKSTLTALKSGAKGKLPEKDRHKRGRYIPACRKGAQAFLYNSPSPSLN